MIYRFLLMFESFRDALSRAQRAEDEALRLRARVEELETKYDNLQVEARKRAEELFDRVTVKPVRPVSDEHYEEPKRVLNPQMVAKQMTSKFFSDLAARREVLLAEEQAKSN